MGAHGVEGGADPASLTSATYITSAKPAVGVDGMAALEAPLPASPLPTATLKKEQLALPASAPPTTVAALSISIPSHVTTREGWAPDMSSKELSTAGDVAKPSFFSAGEPASSKGRLKMASVASPAMLGRLVAAFAPATFIRCGHTALRPPAATWTTTRTA